MILLIKYKKKNEFTIRKLATNLNILFFNFYSVS